MAGTCVDASPWARLRRGPFSSTEHNAAHTLTRWWPRMPSPRRGGEPDLEVDFFLLSKKKKRNKIITVFACPPLLLRPLPPPPPPLLAAYCSAGLTDLRFLQTDRHTTHTLTRLSCSPARHSLARLRSQVVSVSDEQVLKSHSLW